MAEMQRNAEQNDESAYLWCGKEIKERFWLFIVLGCKENIYYNKWIISKTNNLLD